MERQVDDLTDEELVDITATRPCFCSGAFRCTKHLALDEFLRREREREQKGAN